MLKNNKNKSISELNNHKMVDVGVIRNFNGQTVFIDGRFLTSGKVPAKSAQLSSSA